MGSAGLVLTTVGVKLDNTPAKLIALVIGLALIAGGTYMMLAGASDRRQRREAQRRE